MRNMLGVLVWLWVVVACGQTPKVLARSALLMEARSGQVLYAKNAHLRLPPASLTKMLTALVVVEHADLDEEVTASKRAVETPASSMHLREGEQVSVRDLLYALLLRSANDSAVALAEHVGGSVEQFVQMMNQKAQALGARNTHLVNPHGLDAPNHYSTAYDMALIARAFMEHPTLRAIVGQRYYIVQRSLNQEDLWMVNKSKFLQLYPYAEGIKTGYTRPAGFCFAGSAMKQGRRLIAVVLNSPQREQDTISMMEYGFWEWVPLEMHMPLTPIRVEAGETDHVAVRLERPAYWVVPAHQKDTYRWELKPLQLQAPVGLNHLAGWLQLKQGDATVLQIPLRTAASVGRRPSSNRLSWAGLLLTGLLAGWGWRQRLQRRSVSLRLHRYFER